MRLRYAGTCTCCGARLAAGSYAFYDAFRKSVRCPSCPAWPTVVGAGASARHEYARRKVSQERQLRAKWGRWGGVAVALSSEPQSTKAWATGAAGEVRVAAVLADLTAHGVGLLHDRRIPGTRANIDHIAVTATGIWVIDTKRYAGRPRLKVTGGLLSPRVEKLLVGSRDCTRLVESVLRQAALVHEVIPAAPIYPVLCFVDSDWPLLAGPFATRGVKVMTPRMLKKALSRQAQGPGDVAGAVGALARAFPVA